MDCNVSIIGVRCGRSRLFVADRICIISLFHECSNVWADKARILIYYGMSRASMCLSRFET